MRGRRGYDMICEEGCEMKVVGDMFSRLHGCSGARIVILGIQATLRSANSLDDSDIDHSSPDDLN
jgi:hypothetical protein